MPVVRFTAVMPPALPAIDGHVTDYRDAKVHGLMLRVTPAGSRVWYVVYKRHERNRHYRLGRLEHVSLAEARTAAKRIRHRVGLGEDPQLDRLAERHRAKQSVSGVCRLYLEREGPHLSPRTLREWHRVVDVEIAPALGGRPAAELTRSEVRQWSERLRDRSGHVAAHAFAVLRRVYSWAVGEDRLPGSPFVGLKPPAHPPAEARVLSARELRALVLALNDRGGPSAELVRLLLLTLARASMVTGMTRDELHDLDGRRPAWIVQPRPGLKRRRGGLAHVVPLSPAALAIVRRRLGLVSGPELFPTAPRPDGRQPKHATTALSHAWMSRLRRAMDVRYAADELGLDLEAGDPREAHVARQTAADALRRGLVERRPRWTAHHLRHTGATQLREQLGVSEEVVGLLLAHTRRRMAEATRVYDRSELIGDRRAALVAWAAWLEALAGGAPAPAKVLPMARG